MAKKTTVAKKTGRNVATTRPGSGRSVARSEGSIAEMMALDAGKGVSTAMEDNVVPLVYILQALSPQCIKGSPKQVKGAKAGDIWFRGTNIVIDGDEGMLVQPAHFDKCWIEWMPDRGGFVGRHLSRPKEAVQVSDPKKPERKVWEMPNGNVVSESREHVVLVHSDKLPRPTPFVIPMAGSQHSSSRNWMMLMNSKEVEIDGEPTGKTAPSYGYMYRMCTAHRTNGKDNWFGWEITDGGDDNEVMPVEDIADYKTARKIFEDFNKGVLRADVGESSDDMPDSDDNEEDNT